MKASDYILSTVCNGGRFFVDKGSGLSFTRAQNRPRKGRCHKRFQHQNRARENEIPETKASRSQAIDVEAFRDSSGKIENSSSPQPQAQLPCKVSI